MSYLKQAIMNIICDIFFKDGATLSSLASEVVIRDNNIGFSIDVTSQSLEEAESIRKQAIERLSQVDGIGNITITLTAGSPQNKAQNTKHYINNVKKVFLVAAGKGGVGKSTIAATIAENLTAMEYKVGIVDADIYGPSLPTIFNINQKPEIINGKIIPLINRGVQLNSIGFLINSSTPLAWRGPMASKAIYQLLSLSLWDNLDYLIVDMPPGTGDIHLSILNNYHIDGVIIVTTPQKLSEVDAAKSIELYQKFHLPILAILENMSYFIDSNNTKLEIFKGDSAKSLAAKYNIPFAYQIPLDPQIAAACDTGQSLGNILKLPVTQFIN